MKRTLCLLCSCLLLAGCGADAQTPADIPENDAAQTQAVTEALPAETEDPYDPGLPERDFGGHEFLFLVRGEAFEPTNFSHEIYAEEENGEAINDAVFQRNMAVQEQFNIVIREDAADDNAGTVKNMVSAGDNTYDAVMIRPVRAVSIAADGYLYDLNTLPYLNLKAEWWDQNAAENLTLNGHLYFINGALNIMDNNAIWALMFNKNLFNRYDIDYPYADVQNGTWTLDKFLDIAKLGGSDLNGDGKMDETDQYGLIMANENVFPFVLGAGCRFCERTSDGGAVLNPDIERMSAVLDRLYPVISDENITLYGERYNGKGYTNFYAQVMRESFRAGRSLMYVSGILSATYLRDMQDEFGIVPLPKLDAAQETYYSRMQLNNSSMLEVPACCVETERTGIILEALAAKSMTTLSPAYYETTLSGKVARDTESAAMLDLILGSVIFDFAEVFNIGSVPDLVYAGAMKNQNDIASKFEKNRSKMEKNLTKVIETYGQQS